MERPHRAVLDGCARLRYNCRLFAGIAQLVERNLAKVEVGSSRLLSRSTFQKGRAHQALPFLVSVPSAARFGRQPLAGWQSGHAAACKAVYAGSIPTPASIGPGYLADDELAPSSSHAFARASKSGRCGRTTQNRWPVGACITHHRLILATRVAPSASSRRTSASMSSVSISMCARLA